MPAYCVAADVRVLTGVTVSMMSDADITALIVFSDQQINDDIAPATGSTRITHLSAVLTAMKIFNRPDFR